MTEEEQIKVLLEKYDLLLKSGTLSKADVKRAREAVQRVKQQRQLIIAYRLGVIENQDDRLN